MAAAIIAAFLSLMSENTTARGAAIASTSPAASPDAKAHRERVKRLRNVCRWAPVFGGVAASDIQGFELAVVDGVAQRNGSVDAAPREVRSLRKRGMLVVSYLSVGTVEGWRHYAPMVPASWTLADVEGWPNERFVDVRQRGWQRIMVAEIQVLASAGFDGVYLDNLDVAEQFPETKAAVVELVTKMRAAAPALLLIGQNGLVVASRLPIDAVAHEDVFSRWDDGYRPSTTEETAAILPSLRRLRARGLPVFTLDYARPGSRDAQVALARSLAEGFHPAVSVLALNRVPHAVPRC